MILESQYPPINNLVQIYEWLPRPNNNTSSKLWLDFTFFKEIELLTTNIDLDWAFQKVNFSIIFFFYRLIHVYKYFFVQCEVYVH